ncbi:hypothetical protein [Daejeonella sp.]|uniref:hypothetical protein n=1 Tax=Daejeonella sp. TaxID=2805397 RepID=UPI0030BD1FF5
MLIRSSRQHLHYILLLGTCLSFSNAAFGIQDTLIPSQRTNLSFNSIYRQNVNPGFFGNEYGNPIKTSLVADVNPNVILLNSSKSRFFAVFSPRVKLRLLNARKAPVRSPSYMPGLKIYSRINNDTLYPQFLSLAYSHHSNGQDGPTLDPSGRFNRGGGKFTTNYYTLDYTIGKRNVSSVRSMSQYGSLGIELHTGLFNRGYSRELKDQYGFVRVNGSWVYDILTDKRGNDKYSDHQRIHAKFTYITDRYEDYSLGNLRKRLNISAQYNYQPGFTDNVALALGVGYRGQDDYNIYFEDSYSYVSVGVVYGVAFDLRKKRH